MNNAIIPEFCLNGQTCKRYERHLHERVLTRIGRALISLGDRVAEARRARRTFEELSAMNDHELEDIGITRSDIPAIVAGTYRGLSPTASNVIPLDGRRRVRPSDTAPALPKRPSAA